MERLKGGNVLLNFTNITLAIGEKTSITDSGILKQLKELYPLVKSGSPKNLVFIKVADASEESIVPCQLLINGNSIEIRGRINADATSSYGLVIEVTYSVGEYDALSITSCKYTFSGDIAIDGDILDSNGNTAIDIGTSDISISKNVNIGNTGSTKDLYVSGQITSGGSLYIHPITLVYNEDEDTQIRVACFIFDNNSNAYTKSTFYDKIVAIHTAIGGGGEVVRIPMTGGIGSNGTIEPTSWAYYTDATKLSISFITGNTIANITKELFTSKTGFFEDGVNKIL